MLKHFRVNADLSHWCCVSEHVFDKNEGRDKTWWPQTLANLASNTEMIHCRVGSDQSPQVNDPSLPVNAAAVEAHLEWWGIIMIIMKGQAERGKTEFYVTPEFGPSPYMPSNVDGSPVADLEKVNRWIKDKVVEMYKTFDFCSQDFPSQPQTASMLPVNVEAPAIQIIDSFTIKSVAKRSLEARENVHQARPLARRTFLHRKGCFGFSVEYLGGGFALLRHGNGLRRFLQLASRPPGRRRLPNRPQNGGGRRPSRQDHLAWDRDREGEGFGSSGVRGPS